VKEVSEQGQKVAPCLEEELVWPLPHLDERSVKEVSEQGQKVAPCLEEELVCTVNQVS
jgi:hypothetical protein